jgi:plastocyanin
METFIDNRATDKSHLIADIDDDDVGAYPSPRPKSQGSSPNYVGAATDIIIEAISAADDVVKEAPIIGYAYTGAQVIDKLLPDVRYEDPSTSERFEWTYNNTHPEDGPDYGYNGVQDVCTYTAFMIKNKNDESKIDFKLSLQGTSNSDSVLNFFHSWRIQEDAADHIDSQGEVSPEQPVAGYDYSPANPEPGQEVVFNGGRSYDPDGKITEYQWEVMRGDETMETGTGKQFEITFPTPGTYPVKLTVTDNGDQTHEKQKSINVEEYDITRFDQNGNGKIEISELQEAIAAYNSNENIGGKKVSTRELQQAVVIFNNNQPI